MASAQKGLMAMTGISFVVGKRTIIEQSKTYPKRSYYCNLYMQYHYFEAHGEMHFTPPVQTVYAMRQAIKEYFAEGEQKNGSVIPECLRLCTRGLNGWDFRI